MSMQKEISVKLMEGFITFAKSQSPTIELSTDEKVKNIETTYPKMMICDKKIASESPLYAKIKKNLPQIHLYESIIGSYPIFLQGKTAAAAQFDPNNVRNTSSGFNCNIKLSSKGEDDEILKDLLIVQSHLEKLNIDYSLWGQIIKTHFFDYYMTYITSKNNQTYDQIVCCILQNFDFNKYVAKLQTKIMNYDEKKSWHRKEEIL